MWLTEILERNCQQRPDQLAVIDDDRTLTWTQLADRSRALAGYLSRCGVRRHDLVGVLSRNRLEVLESYFAAARLGAAFVPLNHALVPDELADIVGRLRPRLVLGEAELISRIDLPDEQLVDFDAETYIKGAGSPTELPEPAAEVSLADPMAILLTSATTGRPKAVVQTHAAMMQMTLGWLAAVRPDDDLVLLNLNPLSHGSIQVTFNYLAAGATVALLRQFTPQGALREIERSRVTHVWLVPQMLRFILRSRALGTADLSSLREVMHGAAPMPAEVLAEARLRMPCPLRNVYGMTEVGGPFATVTTAEYPDEGAGWPAGRGIPGLLVGIFDPRGVSLAAGKIGEVCVRGTGRMREYLHDPVATAEVFRGDWLRTGDLGWLDEQGYIHLVDRVKDLIIRGGQNVYPAEIEQCLLSHDDIVDVAVIKVPDEDWGESPVAYVVLREPARAAGSTGRLITYLRSRLASYKIPSAIRLTDEIPRNGAGKALKRVLVARYQSEAQPVPDPTADRPAPDVGTDIDMRLGKQP